MLPAQQPEPKQEACRRHTVLRSHCGRSSGRVVVPGKCAVQESSLVVVAQVTQPNFDLP